MSLHDGRELPSQEVTLFSLQITQPEEFCQAAESGQRQAPEDDRTRWREASSGSEGSVLRAGVTPVAAGGTWAPRGLQGLLSSAGLGVARGWPAALPRGTAGDGGADLRMRNPPAREGLSCPGGGRRGGPAQALRPSREGTVSPL